MNFTENFWEITYRTQINRMIGICYRYVGDRQIAQDLAHDGFVIAMDNCASYRGEGHFDAWLRRIIINNALRYLRDKKYVKSLDDCLISKHAYSELSESVVDTDVLTRDELFAAINALPEHHKLVFNLYVLDNYTHAQIAEELGISTGTSKSHLSRARKKLRELLDKNKIRESSGRKRNKVFLVFVFPFNQRLVDYVFQQTFYDFSMCDKSLNFLDPIQQSHNPKVTFKSSIFKSYRFGVKLILGLTIIPVVASLMIFNLFPFEPINHVVDEDSASSTATILQDSVILLDHLKIDTGMKGTKQLSIIMLAAASVAIDSEGQACTELIGVSYSSSTDVFSASFVSDEQDSSTYVLKDERDSIKVDDVEVYLQDLISGEINHVEKNSKNHFAEEQVEKSNNPDSEMNAIVFQNEKYLLDFCDVADESIGDIHKWEIDLSCCGGKSYYSSSNQNGVETLVYFSLKSKGTKGLSKGTYRFTSQSISNQKSMTFKGEAKVAGDELTISGGELTVDYSREYIIIKFRLQVGYDEYMTGSYIGSYTSHFRFGLLKPEKRKWFRKD